MAETIRIQMMDHFLIFIDEKKTDHLAAKSKKGAALVQYLILNAGEPVPNQKLLNALWDEEKSTNPENALKTLVSRLRVLLDTDAKNEADDQYAITHHLLTPMFDVRGIVESRDDEYRVSVYTRDGLTIREE